MLKVTDIPKQARGSGKSLLLFAISSFKVFFKQDYFAPRGRNSFP